MKKFELIIVDMDGVLSNFRKGVFDLFDIKNTEENLKVWNMGKEILNIEEKDFWDVIKNEKDFWLNLEPFPWKDELMKIVDGYADNVMICSKSPMDPSCYSQKRKWLDKYGLGGYEHFIGSATKGWLAKKERVLIDDYIRNVLNFIVEGGDSILFPQQYNLKYWEDEDCRVIKKRINYVEEMLNKILIGIG